MPRKPFAKGGRNYVSKETREEILKSEKARRDARRTLQKKWAEMLKHEMKRPLTTSPTPIIILNPSSPSNSSAASTTGSVTDF